MTLVKLAPRAWWWPRTSHRPRRQGTMCPAVASQYNTCSEGSAGDQSLVLCWDWRQGVSPGLVQFMFSLCPCNPVGAASSGWAEKGLSCCRVVIHKQPRTAVLVNQPYLFPKYFNLVSMPNVTSLYKYNQNWTGCLSHKNTLWYLVTFLY